MTSTDARLETRVARVDRIDPSSGLCLLQLDAVPQVGFAGQYVKVWTPVRPGGDDAATEALRYVSLASPPGAPASLLLMPSGADAPDGDPAALAVGDALQISAVAAGRLTLQDVPGRPTLWLLAAGTGLAPMRAILAAGVPERFAEVVLVHAVQRAERLAFAAEFEAMQAAGRLRYLPMLSRERREGMLHGRIPAAIADGSLAAAAGVALLPEASAVLICGAAGMVADTRAALEARGFDADKGARLVVTEF